MGAFSDVGLAMQGATMAEQDRQKTRTGQLGLEDLERQNTAAAEERAAVAGSPDNLDATYGNVAAARKKSGNLAGSVEASQQRVSAANAAELRLAMHAQRGTDPRQAEEEYRKAGFGEGGQPGSLTWGQVPGKDDPAYAAVSKDHPDWQPGDHLIMVKGSDGQMHVKNATSLIRMSTEQKVHSIAPGGSALVTQPGAAPQLVHGAGKVNATRTGMLYDTTTGDVKYTPPDDNWSLGEIQNGDKKVPVSFNKKTGDAVVLGQGGNPTHTQVHTGPDGKTTIAIGDKVFEVAPGTPATPGKSHLFSPDEPATPAKPASLVPVNTDGPPIDGARKAADGKWYVKSGDGYAEVIPAGGAAAAPVAPAPAAKKASATKPAAAKPAPTKTDDEKIPDVASPVEAGLAPAARHQSRVAAARGDQDKARAEAPKKRAVETFRAIASSPRMTAEDAPLIKEALDTGLLTPAEKSKAERMLAKLQPQTAGYARGGKVQRFGL